ncbi:pleiotropic drug resistance protein 1-like isoform X2 [Arachis ipaensis]|uniref:pleiotropic drug resistance protein 1-like isoform X2 n=1 Tax=Arachis ipaensis TaxID=130454 RepID=UPI0007AFBC43|nr:pleiotropic drug resistance protein 1-like isoform X2 [Arachis ipaensis]XP_025677394.1 pleiotropic drug resistance protein 1-like isoform X2 [Arachis hypogaea]
MEGSDIYRGSNSLRSTSFRLRRNKTTSSENVFSKTSSSCEEEDDEEALKWASLEKLPTYNRLRKGLLATSRGVANEIDITELGFQDRQKLLDRLIKVAEEDNENFLLKLRERIDRVGLNIPTVEVRFEHLNVEAEVLVGSRAMPTFLNFAINRVESVLTFLHIMSSKKKQVTIFKDVSGIIKPRRMTLLLGPPSSGKTTLLLALSGKLDPSLKVSGRVSYNGHEMNEFVPQRTAAYISQHDVHIGEMTVRETLTFSARCQGVGSRYDLLSELSRREKEAKIKPDSDIDVYMKATTIGGQEASLVTDYVLKILGLDICANTMVGNEMLRGISGGQRKRVTIGEMLVGPANALFMDEISTGLDSSTTFQIVSSLKQYVHILNGTAFISLLQPTPETYELFDDIVLISDGEIIYQGPREHVLDFFHCMGFNCPERKSVADFLQEVTSKKDQEQYWSQRDQPYNFISATQFAEAFQSFHVGKGMVDELSIPFDKSMNHRAALTTKKYGTNLKELVKANISREYLLLKRNSFVYIFKLSQVTMIAIITMTLFLRTKMHRESIDDGSVYIGALYFSLSMLTVLGISEISMASAKLAVLYKQRDHLFYPSWAYAIPTWILKIPLSFLDVANWVFLTYYVIGYDSNVARFFKQYLVLFLTSQMASGLFRAVAALSRNNVIVANTFGATVGVIILLLGGFILSRKNIKDWWIWGYWISPITYGLNAIMVNEFLGKSWHKFTQNSNKTLGVQALESHGFFTHAYWYWIGVGVLIGYIFLFNILYTMALTYLTPFENQRATIIEEEEGNATNDDIAQEVELPHIVNASNNSSNGRRRKGMVLPFEPHSITFDEVVYSVDMPQEMKDQGVIEDRLVLLKGVSGAFRPGVLTALMGVTGAGKTTLMDVLAGRKTGGYIDGSIKISGYPKKQETFARISGYCEQNDIHSPHITVYESLFYSAWLRLSVKIDSNDKKMFIEEVMELVELNLLRNSLVGLPGINGLSIEQRKRLTIAVELVANPSIIFMDEPTSGLDARAAAIVMRTIRNIVDTGRTILCTIHQPNIDIFEAFDELFLLKRGGQEIYVGPLGHHSSQLIKYFESIDGVTKIKDGHNPATWMLEATSSAKELNLGVDFHEIYKNSDLYRRNKEMIAELGNPDPDSNDLHFPNKYAQPFWVQFQACLWKQHWSYWRNPSYTAIRFFTTIILAFIFGTIFWNLGGKYSNKQDLSNAMGSIYIAVLFLGLQYASSVQPVVAIERVVFYRENAAGMYSALPYAIAQVLIELPYIFAQATTYGVMTYAMIGFEWTPRKFFWYLFFMYFAFCYYTFYGMMTVALTPNRHVASIVASSFYAIWNLFSGFIIPPPRMPVWWKWYYWACPVSWTLYGTVASQFGDITHIMESEHVSVQDFIRSYYGFKHDFVGVCAIVVFGFAMLFALIFAIAIKVLNFQRR